MKTKIMLIALSLALGAWNLGMAGEHPSEHPTETREHPTETKSEHPTETKSEHPTKAGKEHPKKGVSNKAFQDNYEKIVREYVESESKKTGGLFTIKDEVTNKEWKLKLTKVHKNKICMLQQGKLCFACADFKTEGWFFPTKLDLDFYADRADDGTITISKVMIHKVNGKRRFTYNKNNEIVPTVN